MRLGRRVFGLKGRERRGEKARKGALATPDIDLAVGNMEFRADKMKPTIKFF